MTKQAGQRLPPATPPLLFPSAPSTQAFIAPPQNLFHPAPLSQCRAQPVGWSPINQQVASFSVIRESGRRAEYMNFDKGAHNTRGCDDVTRQSFLPLLHSLSLPPVWLGTRTEGRCRWWWCVWWWYVYIFHKAIWGRRAGSRQLSRTLWDWRDTWKHLHFLIKADLGVALWHTHSDYRTHMHALHIYFDFLGGRLTFH